MFKISYKNLKWPIAVPCLPLMVCACLSAAPFLLSYTFQFSIYLTTASVIPVLFILLKSLKNYKRDVTIVTIAAVSALVATHIHKSHISIHEPVQRSYITVKGIVENVHYHDEVLNWEAQENSKVTLKLLEIFKDGIWLKCSGKIHLQEEENTLQFGDKLSVEGALFAYKSPENNRLFSYGNYLKSQKISHWMRLDKLLKKESASGLDGLLKSCYKFRDTIITQAGKGLKSEKDRKLLASMFFGYKGLLAPEEKEIFKRSGTVHLFAVSGLHIGIAAFFLLSVLKLLQLPLKVQSVCLISILGVYVIMTGAPASAVRAFVMISVWSIAKGFMLPSNGLNNIAFSAFLLILANPLNLLSAGFYYTFIITTFLVATYLKSLDIFQDLMEKKLWMGRSGWSSSFSLKVFMLFSCSFCASLAGFGLNLLINEKVIPFALFTNMAASTLAWLSFMTAVFCLSGLPIFYSIQEVLLKLIRFTAENGEMSWNGSSSLLLVLVFYLLLFLAVFQTNPKRIQKLSLILFSLIIFLAWPRVRNSLDISVPSSSNIATVVLRNEGRTYMINCSSGKTVRSLFHENIDALILPDIRADHIRQLEALLQNSFVKEVIIFKKPSAYLERILKETDKRHLLKVRQDFHLVQNFEYEQDRYLIELNDSPPDSRTVQVSIQRETLGMSKIKFTSRRINKELTFKYSNIGYHENFSY